MKWDTEVSVAKEIIYIPSMVHGALNIFFLV